MLRNSSTSNPDSPDYRAARVDFTAAAKEQIAELERLGLDKMPICMAKTQYSFSDNEKLLGAPTEFTITVREIRVSAGAGFIIALTGSKRRAERVVDRSSESLP